MGSPPRAQEVAKWQQKYRVDWDAADGRNGGAERTVWEILSEMERVKYQTGEKNQGAVTKKKRSGRGEDIRAGQSPCGVGLGDALQVPMEDIAGAVRLFRAPEARRMRGGAAPNHHGHLARIPVELFAFTHCSAGCVELSHKHLPVFEAEGFCKWHHGLGERQK